MKLKTNYNEVFGFFFLVVESQDLITGCAPYLGLELIMHVLKNQIHFVRQSL
jgi:hypothetical protein